MPNHRIGTFDSNPNAETVFLIQDIGDDDTEFTFDVYTRNPRNAKRALEDIKLAIDDLLDEWSKCQTLPSTTASESLTYSHSGGIWPLHISRP